MGRLGMLFRVLQILRRECYGMQDRYDVFSVGLHRESILHLVEGTGWRYMV